MKEERGKEINFKHWISRTILVGMLLIVIIYGIQIYFQLELVVIALVAITVAIMFGLFHELCHYLMAIKLGYIPVWYRTTMMFGFDIDTHNKTEKQKQKDLKLSPRQLKEQNVKDSLRVGRFPYLVALPFSIVFLIMAIIIKNYGIIIGCVAIIMFHIIGYKKEGIEL